MESEERARLERYLQGRFGDSTRIVDLEPLGGDGGEKGFGYGVPVRARLVGSPVADVVIHTTGTSGFGHDTLADRAAAAFLAFETFSHLPHHVRALDVGIVDRAGERVSLADARDFFTITEYAEGEPYFKDLERIAATGEASERDFSRAERLASYLARIHTDRHTSPEGYRRRTRDLFGHHECIAGLLDSYDGVGLERYTSRAELQEIERRCVAWRHRLKEYPHRLCRVHGDFHPWNVLWDSDELRLLDRSRGEWGEAADDVSCMAINYLFFALRSVGRMEGPFAELWGRFWDTYLQATADQELTTVIAPFFVWRALVLASPIWYPHIPVAVRRALFVFIDRVLEMDRFDLTTAVEGIPC